MYIPLINNVQPVPKYNGYDVRLGEDSAHLEKAPALVPIKGKIVFLCIGASTPGQISTVIESRANANATVDIINCCVGAEDINDWLNLDGAGWANVESRLKANGYRNASVQGIIMCHDDLKDPKIDFAAAVSLSNKLVQFIELAKTQFPKLRQVELFSRLCEYKISDQKFGTPSGYHTGWANKLTVEHAKLNTGFIDGVWVTDRNGYLWTDGETVRSDGFAFKFAWMKQRETSVHLDTAKQGDDICADYIFNNLKRYAWFK